MEPSTLFPSQTPQPPVDLKQPIHSKNLKTWLPLAIIVLIVVVYGALAYTRNWWPMSYLFPPSLSGCDIDMGRDIYVAKNENTGECKEFKTYCDIPSGWAWTEKCDNQADWKTYTNSAYGFEFKYPSEWKMVEGDGNNYDLSVVSIFSPESQKNSVGHDDISVYYYPFVSDESENTLNHLGAKTLDELVQKNPVIKKIGSIEIDGIQGIDVIWGGQGAYYVILVMENSHLYKIWFNNVSNKSMLSATENQILSTFKFGN